MAENRVWLLQKRRAWLCICTSQFAVMRATNLLDIFQQCVRLAAARLCHGAGITL